MRTPSRLALGLALGAGLAACSSVPPAGPSVEGGATFAYTCSDGSVVAVRYYALSDGSLRFARLRMQDGTELTLPQLVSGSGARYSDDHTTFWIKGNQATLSESGSSRTLECGAGQDRAQPPAR
ncbi:MAG: MliC family protein [Betaproteobacteria bacterium]|nr:MliC family protein [Betaproteobacteria bacterium]